MNVVLTDGVETNVIVCFLLVKKTISTFYFLQMTTEIAIEDARREVNMLRALTGHRILVQFYEAYDDENNVYIVME